MSKTFHGRGVVAFLVTSVIMASPGSADPAPDVADADRYLFTGDAFAAATHTAAIVVDPISGAVALSPTEYIIPGSGNKLYGTTAKTGFGRKLSFDGQLIGKHIFHLRDQRTLNGATVALFGRDGEATFNGAPLLFEKRPNQAGWIFAAVAAETLRQGENVVIFTKGFGLAQDREQDPPRRSWLSKDQGQTWQVADGGEFLVNLRLERHRDRGAVTSAVIDLATPAGDNRIGALPVGPLTCALACDGAIPHGTDVILEARRGGTPWPDRSWGKWQTGPTTGKERYLQWRATLATSDPRLSPCVSNITLVVSRRAAPPAHSDAILQTLDHHIINSGSYGYDLQRPSAKLTRLRQAYKLDEIVSAGQSDFERLLLLRNWVRRQWPGNDGFGGRWDALEILAAPPGHKGMCVQFGNLFAQCALALGYVARPVIIHHHFIAEAWLDDLGKWVAFDVEGCYPPQRFANHATAHYEAAATRLPLSAREVCDAYWRAVELKSPSLNEVIQVFAYDTPAAAAVAHDVVRPTEELSTYAVIALPLRNNHLDVAEPWEEYHGQDYYHANDYLWWQGPRQAATPPQYPLATGRVADFEWSVNQTQLAIVATKRRDRLLATVKTMTPNFDSFNYRFNDAPWQKLRGQAKHPDQQWATLEWPLTAATNRLEVRAVNRFNRHGAASVAVVTKADTTAATHGTPPPSIAHD